MLPKTSLVTLTDGFSLSRGYVRLKEQETSKLKLDAWLFRQFWSTGQLYLRRLGRLYRNPYWDFVD